MDPLKNQFGIGIDGSIQVSEELIGRNPTGFVVKSAVAGLIRGR